MPFDGPRQEDSRFFGRLTIEVSRRTTEQSMQLATVLSSRAAGRRLFTMSSDNSIDSGLVDVRFWALQAGHGGGEGSVLTDSSRLGTAAEQRRKRPRGRHQVRCDASFTVWPPKNKRQSNTRSRSSQPLCASFKPRLSRGVVLHVSTWPATRRLTRSHVVELELFLTLGRLLCRDDILSRQGCPPRR